MWFKETLKEKLGTEESIILHRYKSAKFLFILLAFLFLLNYFFVWSKFYYEFFIKTIYGTYILLLVSFFSFLYFLWKLKLFGKVKNYVFYITWFLYFVLFLILIAPMLFESNAFYLKALF